MEDHLIKMEVDLKKMMDHPKKKGKKKKKRETSWG
jgi:hypothetical protein